MWGDEATCRNREQGTGNRGKVGAVAIIVIWGPIVSRVRARARARGDYFLTSHSISYSTIVIMPCVYYTLARVWGGKLRVRGRVRIRARMIR